MAELPDNRLARSRRLARRCWWLLVVGVGSSLTGAIAPQLLADGIGSQWLGVGGLLWIGLSIVAPLVVLVRLHGPAAPRAVARTAVVWITLIVLLWVMIVATSALELLQVPPGPIRSAILLAYSLVHLAALMASSATFLTISQSAADPKPSPRVLPARACWRLLTAVTLIRAALIIPFTLTRCSDIAAELGWITAQHWSRRFLYELPWSGLSILGMAAYAAELFLIIVVAIRLRAFSQGLIVFRPGLCALCGYDLSGLSTPRCPECGSAAA